MVSDPVAATDWRQLATDTKIPDGMFIGGEPRAAIDGSTRAVNAERDASTLVDLAWAQPADADAAVSAARTAFDHGVKLSSFGRDKSRHALGEYTYLKTTWIRYA